MVKKDYKDYSFTAPKLLKTNMQSEKQYIDLYTEAQQMIKEHAAPVMNEVRDKAFDDFRRLGFPYLRRG